MNGGGFKQCNRKFFSDFPQHFQILRFLLIREFFPHYFLGFSGEKNKYGSEMKPLPEGFKRFFFQAGHAVQNRRSTLATGLFNVNPFSDPGADFACACTRSGSDAPQGPGTPESNHPIFIRVCLDPDPDAMGRAS